MINKKLNDDGVESAGRSSVHWHGSKALYLETSIFCQRYRLTPRESEIVGVLAEGVTRIKDIADRLRLSPNTVNNHVNSIFMKTKARSKSQLLAMLLSRISEELQAARFFKQTPRVMLIARNPALVSKLAEALGVAGFRVELAGSVDECVSRIADVAPHFAIADLSLPDLDAKTVVKRLASVSNVKTLLVSPPGAVHNRCDAMCAGAIDLVDAQAGADHLVATLICHFIESDADRERYMRTLTESPDTVLKRAREILEIPQADLGKGGVFLCLQDLERNFGEELKVGERLELKLKIKGFSRPLHAQGEVVWTRVGDAVKRCGAGVRFLHFAGATDEERNSWRSYLNQNATSYIPAGEPTEIRATS